MLKLVAFAPISCNNFCSSKQISQNHHREEQLMSTVKGLRYASLRLFFRIAFVATEPVIIFSPTQTALLETVTQVAHALKTKFVTEILVSTKTCALQKVK